MNSIKITSVQVSPTLYLIKQESIDYANDLSADKYVAFDENLEFAGISKGGKMLSVPKSPMPASISGYAIKAGLDSQWNEISIGQNGILSTKAAPEIILTQLFKRHGLCAYIKKTDMPERYVVKEYNISQGDQTEIYAAIDLSIKYYDKYKEAGIIHTRQNTAVTFPKNMVLSFEEWQELGQHVYTGNKKCMISETVRIGKNAAIFVQSETLSEAEEFYGITGTPICYENGRLGFREITVVDHDKACKIHPCLASIKKACLTICGDLRMDMKDLCNNPRLLAKLPSIGVYLTFSTVILSYSTFDSSLLDYPIHTQHGYRNKEAPPILVNQNLIKKEFISAKEAARKYKLTANIASYTLKSNTNISGHWYYRKDLELLETINRKAENQATKERRIALMKKGNGTQLPDGWKNHTDKEIETYFHIQNGLRKDTIISIRDSKVIPQEWDHAELFCNWLLKHDLAWNCPFTDRSYIHQFKNITELAEVPGFWDVFAETYDDIGWLAKVICCKKVQELATVCLLD
jgi:hypothetical protein